MNTHAFDSTGTATKVSASPLSRLNLGVFSARAQSLGSVLTVFYCTIIAIIALGFPLANWDMIPYTALAQTMPGQDIAAVHQQAYEAVKGAVSPGDFIELTQDRGYRVAQFAKPDAFATMLPMYEVKWLYIEAVKALSGFTDAIKAERMVNAMAMVAIGIMLTLWLNAGRALVLAPLVIAGLAMCDIGTIARITSPDMFAGAFIIGGLFAFHKKQIVVAAAALALATLARPDHVVMATMLAGMVLVTARDWKSALLLALPAVAASSFAMNVDGYPGWWPHIYLTQIEYVPSLEGFAPEFSLANYVLAVVKAGARAIAEEGWPAMLLLAGTAIIWMAMKHRFAERRELWLASTLLIAVIVKFFIFPANEARFYFAYLVPAMMVMLSAWIASKEAEMAHSGSKIAV
jgi:hypothetical protein